MFKNSVQEAVKDGRIKWQRYALQRMLERDIARDEVKQVLLTDELIEHYPDGYPIESGFFWVIQRIRTHCMEWLEWSVILIGVILLRHTDRIQSILNQVLKPENDEI